MIFILWLLFFVVVLMISGKLILFGLFVGSVGMLVLIVMRLVSSLFLFWCLGKVD